MKQKKRAHTAPHEELFAKLMQDPEFVAEWQRQAPQREIMRMLIEERIKRKKTQKELAEEIGVKPSSLSRLESGSHSPSLAYLSKIAEALGRRLEINLVEK